MSASPLLTFQNNKYLLGVQEKNGEWFIPNRRFFLTSYKNKNTGKEELMGQFITDSWFNKFYQDGSDININIFCVNKNIKVSQLTDSLNHNQMIYHKSWSVFLENKKINEYIKDLEERSTKTIEIKKGDSRIFFKLARDSHGFCVSLPEFIFVQ